MTPSEFISWLSDETGEWNFTGGALRAKLDALLASVRADERERCVRLGDAELSNIGTEMQDIAERAAVVRYQSAIKDSAAPEKHDPRSGPCPTCGFAIKTVERQPFVIEDESEPDSPPPPVPKPEASEAEK